MMAASEPRSARLIEFGSRGPDGARSAADEAALATVAEALDALSKAAFVCDADGRVRARSRATDAVLATREHLTLRGGRLATASEADARMLNAAIRAAALTPSAGGRGAPTILVLRNTDGSEPLLVEVLSLPTERSGCAIEPAALVVVRSQQGEEQRAAAIARALYKLTQAESAVVADLVAGLSPQAIADSAGVSVGTVRTHIRHIFEKSGARSQIELVATITARL